MTALKQYQRLECPGLWRETPEAQRREVIVSFGDASLILSDTKTEAPLTHWSLPALERINPGEVPAIYSPGVEHLETLEFDDTVMIEAIEKVRGVIAARQPRPGRLRNSLLGGAMVLVIGLGVFWLPGALVSHTASVMPSSMRVQIGRMVLDDLTRIAGAPCTATLGHRALGRLANRLFGSGGIEMVILRNGITRAAHLPGRFIVLNRALVEDRESPEVVAGFALAERVQAEASDPMIALLNYAGLRATFGLLTTGALSPDAVRGYAETLVTWPPAKLPTANLLARFEAAGISSAPYAYALDPSGETVLDLIEGDPFRATSPTQILPDGDWVSLQGICAD